MSVNDALVVSCTHTRKHDMLPHSRLSDVNRTIVITSLNNKV